jgi:hypothetical protein
MIYCVIPRELADQLYDKMVEYYKDNPNVTVIVDRREGPDRRSGGEGAGEGEQHPADADPRQHVQERAQAVGGRVAAGDHQLGVGIGGVEPEDDQEHGHQRQACQAQQQRRSRQEFVPGGLAQRNTE